MERRPICRYRISWSTYVCVSYWDGPSIWRGLCLHYLFSTTVVRQVKALGQKGPSLGLHLASVFGLLTQRRNPIIRSMECPTVVVPCALDVGFGIWLLRSYPTKRNSAVPIHIIPYNGELYDVKIIIGSLHYEMFNYPINPSKTGD